MSKLSIIWIINLFALFVVPYFALDVLVLSGDHFKQDIGFGVLVNIVYIIIIVYLILKNQVRAIVMKKNLEIMFSIIIFGIMPLSYDIISDFIKYFNLTGIYASISFYGVFMISFCYFVIWSYILDHQSNKLRKRR